MKHRQVISFPHLVLFLALGSVASASTTCYVNGVSGNDSNNCLSAQTACETIGHAISLAASGDSIRVASATYPENLTIGFSLNVVPVLAPPSLGVITSRRWSRFPMRAPMLPYRT